MKYLNLKFGITLTVLLMLMLGTGKSIFSQQAGQWVAPEDASKVTNPYAGDEQVTKDGETLFTQLCLVCHGKKGKGDGIGGMSLNPRPSNFTKSAVQDQSDGALYWKITTGRPPMAAYETVLNDKQRWSLVNYIRKFKKD
ncbi:MAG: cytochrome c [Chlorobi bacterium]|nr:cytochrome c [Chlorobiota bacterium]